MEDIMELAIPDMPMWTQIGGDMNPSQHGGTIARNDGEALELLKIQPVREYVGSGEAEEVGYPFWTREAWYDLDDLHNGMEEALQFIGMSEETLEEDFTPEQRSLVIAEALLDSGVGAEEGPSGWSEDILSDDVKWMSGTIEGADYLADEDEEFRDEVLGWGDIKEKLEETSDHMIAESAAQGASQLDDQTAIDLDNQGFEGNSAYVIGEFDGAIAVNSDLLVDPGFARELGVGGVEVTTWEEVGTGELERWLEANGYEVTDRGGQWPEAQGVVSVEHLVQAVARETDHDEKTVEEAGQTLDWWPGDSDGEIYGSSDGYVTVWAKRLEEEEEVEERPRRRRR